MFWTTVDTSRRKSCVWALPEVVDTFGFELASLGAARGNREAEAWRSPMLAAMPAQGHPRGRT